MLLGCILYNFKFSLSVLGKLLDFGYNLGGFFDNFFLEFFLGIIGVLFSIILGVSLLFFVAKAVGFFIGLTLVKISRLLKNTVK